MVAVWRCGHLKSMCTCELVPDNAVWMRSMHVDLHRAIRLLNRF